MIVRTISLWKLLSREFTYKVISDTNILHTSFSLLTLSVKSHSLMLRYWMIPGYTHHPKICLHRYSNCGLANGFVMMLACCSFALIYTIFDMPNLICSLKWFHLMQKFHVRGLYFGSFANSITTLLSSKVVLYELHESHLIPNTLDTSNIIFLILIKSLMLWLIMIYSASVVDKPISV